MDDHAYHAHCSHCGANWYLRLRGMGRVVKVTCKNCKKTAHARELPPVPR